MPPEDPVNAHARAPGMLLIPTPDTKCCSSLTWSSAQCCSFCTVAASAEKVGKERDRWWPDVGVGSCKGTSTRPWAVTHPCTCQEGLAQPCGQMQYARQLNSNHVLPLLARFGKRVGGAHMVAEGPARAPAHAVGLSLTQAPARKGWRRHLT